MGLLGCGSDTNGANEKADLQTSDESGVQVRDSAGVEIRVISEAGQDLPVGFRVSEEPILRLTGEEPGVGGLFRTRNAVRLGSGGVVVVMSDRIVVYTSEGELVKVLHPGPGPMEFGIAGTVVPHPSGGFGVWDQERRRVLVFDSIGGFVSTVPLDDGRETLDWSGSVWLRAGLRGFLPDGAFIMLQERRVTVEATHQVVRGTSHVLRYPAEGSRWEEMEVLVSGQRYRVPGFPVAVHPVPFDADPMVEVMGDRIYVADVAETEIRITGHLTGLESVIRRVNPQRTVTPALVDRYIADMMSDAEPGRPREEARRRMDEIPHWPDVRAAFDLFFVSPDGTLFWREPGGCGDDHCWIAHGSEGDVWSVTGMLSDRNHMVTQIGPDVVVALAWDEMGTGALVIHELIREHER